MLYVEPDFYKDFKCTASACRHSCCLGWEIDIDEESLRRFMAVEGEFGEYIRGNIALEPTPHFVLTKDERCPFLQGGLCRMILTLGEESICDICREHPRFYSELPGRIEAGLGLCCEEALRLLYAGNSQLRLVCSGVDDGEADALIELRGEIFRILSEEGISLTERMKKAMALFGMELLSFETDKLKSFYLGLERLDEEWTRRLEALSPVDIEPVLSTLPYSRLCQYFVYRHFAGAPDEYEAALRLQFAFLSTRLVCALDMLSGDMDSARLYSAEIEYSDENVELILDHIDENIPVI